MTDSEQSRQTICSYRNVVLAVIAALLLSGIERLASGSDFGYDQFTGIALTLLLLLNHLSFHYVHPSGYRKLENLLTLLAVGAILYILWFDFL